MIQHLVDIDGGKRARLPPYEVVVDYGPLKEIVIKRFYPARCPKLLLVIF